MGVDVVSQSVTLPVKYEMYSCIFDQAYMRPRDKGEDLVSALVEIKSAPNPTAA